MDRRGIFLGLAFTSLVVASAACSSSGGTGISTPRPSPSPTGVFIGTLGNINCTAPNNALPGTYAALETYGNVANNTYTQNANDAEGDEGDFYTAAYTAASGTPAPTPAPEVIPSVPPTTPGAILFIVYFGEYTLPTTPGLTTATTNGCFTLETADFQEVPDARSRLLATGRIVADASPSPTPSPFIAYGVGYPAFASPYANSSDDIVDGNVNSFVITDLTRTTGTGAFTLGTASVGDELTAAGTAVITGSKAFYTTVDGGEGQLKRRAKFTHRR